MLVLTRHKDESIMVGHDVEIMVVEIRGDKVRLGIRAPKSLAVHRKEIYLAIQRGAGDANRSLAHGFTAEEIAACSASEEGQEAADGR